MQAVGMEVGRFIELVGEGDSQHLARLQAKSWYGHLPVEIVGGDRSPPHLSRSEPCLERDI
jgi:hypothetical protein